MNCFLNVSAHYSRLRFILWCLLEVWQSNISWKPHRRNGIFKIFPIFHRYIPDLHFSNLLLRANAPCLCLYFKSRHGRAMRSGNILQINASIRYQWSESLWSLFYFIFLLYLLKCAYLDASTCVFCVQGYIQDSDMQRGLELGQKRHWSMKLTTIPPWSNVTIMIVLLGTKLPSGCTIHSSPMNSPHATSSFHL